MIKNKQTKKTWTQKFELSYFIIIITRVVSYLRHYIILEIYYGRVQEASNPLTEPSIQ